MRRIKSIAMVAVLAGLCLGLALPVAAKSWNDDRDDVYWTARSVERLLSDDFLDSLRLTNRQRDSLRDLRRDQRFDRRDERLDDLKDILRLVAIGDVLDSNRRSVLDRDLDYLLRTDDDFLYRYYQVLDPSQRRILRDRLQKDYDRWDNRGWQFGRIRWTLSKDLARRLDLSRNQKDRIDRILRDANGSMRDRELRLWRLEKDYFSRNWDPFSARSDAKFRKNLIDARRNTWLFSSQVRQRIRSVLDNRQRRIFDSWRGGIFERVKPHKDEK
jgi:hypothetical protein